MKMKRIWILLFLFFTHYTSARPPNKKNKENLKRSQKDIDADVLITTLESHKVESTDAYSIIDINTPISSRSKSKNGINNALNASIAPFQVFMFVSSIGLDGSNRTDPSITKSKLEKDEAAYADVTDIWSTFTNLKKDPDSHGEPINIANFSGSANPLKINIGKLLSNFGDSKNNTSNTSIPLFELSMNILSIIHDEGNQTNNNVTKSKLWNDETKFDVGDPASGLTFLKMMGDLHNQPNFENFSSNIDLSKLNLEELLSNTLNRDGQNSSDAMKEGFLTYSIIDDLIKNGTSKYKHKKMSLSLGDNDIVFYISGDETKPLKARNGTSTEIERKKLKQPFSTNVHEDKFNTLDNDDNECKNDFGSDCCCCNEQELTRINNNDCIQGRILKNGNKGKDKAKNHSNSADFHDPNNRNNNSDSILAICARKLISKILRIAGDSEIEPNLDSHDYLEPKTGRKHTTNLALKICNTTNFLNGKDENYFESSIRDFVDESNEKHKSNKSEVNRKTTNITTINNRLNKTSEKSDNGSNNDNTQKPNDVNKLKFGSRADNISTEELRVSLRKDTPKKKIDSDVNQDKSDDKSNLKYNKTQKTEESKVSFDNDRSDNSSTRMDIMEKKQKINTNDLVVDNNDDLELNRAKNLKKNKESKIDDDNYDEKTQKPNGLNITISNNQSREEMKSSLRQKTKKKLKNDTNGDMIDDRSNLKYDGKERIEEGSFSKDKFDKDDNDSSSFRKDIVEKKLSNNITNDQVDDNEDNLEYNETNNLKKNNDSKDFDFNNGKNDSTQKPDNVDFLKLDSKITNQTGKEMKSSFEKDIIKGKLSSTNADKVDSNDSLKYDEKETTEENSDKFDDNFSHEQSTSKSTANAYSITTTTPKFKGKHQKGKNFSRVPNAEIIKNKTLKLEEEEYLKGNNTIIPEQGDNNLSRFPNNEVVNKKALILNKNEDLQEKNNTMEANESNSDLSGEPNNEVINNKILSLDPNNEVVDIKTSELNKENLETNITTKAYLGYSDLSHDEPHDDVLDSQTSELNKGIYHQKIKANKGDDEINNDDSNDGNKSGDNKKNEKNSRKELLEVVNQSIITTTESITKEEKLIDAFNNKDYNNDNNKGEPNKADTQTKVDHLHDKDDERGNATINTENEKYRRKEEFTYDDQNITSTTEGVTEVETSMTIIKNNSEEIPYINSSTEMSEDLENVTRRKIDNDDRDVDVEDINSGERRSNYSSEDVSEDVTEVINDLSELNTDGNIVNLLSDLNNDDSLYKLYENDNAASGVVDNIKYEGEKTKRNYGKDTNALNQYNSLSANDNDDIKIDTMGDEMNSELNIMQGHNGLELYNINDDIINIGPDLSNIDAIFETQTGDDGLFFEYKPEEFHPDDIFKDYNYNRNGYDSFEQVSKMDFNLNFPGDLKTYSNEGFGKTRLWKREIHDQMHETKTVNDPEEIRSQQIESLVSLLELWAIREAFLSAAANNDDDMNANFAANENGAGNDMATMKSNEEYQEISTDKDKLSKIFKIK